MKELFIVTWKLCINRGLLVYVFILNRDNIVKLLNRMGMLLMVRIYRKQNFNVYSDRNGSYIIHNIKKDFSNGHTHLNNYHTAKFIIDLAIHKTLPEKNISPYLIDSLIRISIDKKYIHQLEYRKKKGKG